MIDCERTSRLTDRTRLARRATTWWSDRTANVSSSVAIRATAAAAAVTTFKSGARNRLTNSSKPPTRLRATSPDFWQFKMLNQIFKLFLLFNKKKCFNYFGASREGGDGRSGSCLNSGRRVFQQRPKEPCSVDHLESLKSDCIPR